MKHALLLLLLAPAVLRADGGVVRRSERHGSLQVTVFTSPIPIQAGPIDVSVLVQDAATGKPRLDGRIWVRAEALDHPGPRVEHLATREAATNKLLQSALFELPTAGRWRIAIEIEGQPEPAWLQFEVEAAEPPPRWLEMWPWIAAPLLPATLFILHRFLAGRSRSRGVS
jgi:hypothetical protein